MSAPSAVRIGRRPLLKLGVCLLLAGLTTLACGLLLDSLHPGAWTHLFYLRWLLPPALVVLWCSMLMPSETRAVYRAAGSHPSVALALAVLLASAAVLTSCTDVAFEWGAVSARLKRDVVQPNAWATNVLILFCAYALALAATSRVATAQLLVAPAYLLLNFATLAKLEHMHSALQPLDLLRLPEFIPLFRRFFGTGMLVASVLALALWVAGLLVIWRTRPTPMGAGCRVALGAGALGVLLAFPLGFALAPTRPPVAALLRQLGAPELQHRDKVRTNGLVLSFLSEMPQAFVVAPRDYSAEAVAKALSRTPGATAPPAPPGHVNLILYVVESFMDSDDLGLHLTSDPLPNMHALRKAQSGGYGIVPEIFSGSANTEFEVLTGMTMSFLPAGSLPFRQYIRHPLPSLPRALGDLGFATTAIQADARYYYNREQVYALLGFQHVVWLNDVPGVERAARPGWPSDRAVVDAVIEASRGPHPFFVFAFPSSTHSPYTSGVYRDSDLDVLDPPPSDRHGELKEYINTIRVADQAIGTLIEHFGRQPDSTIIAILGDHVAPLSTDALAPFLAQLADLPEVERARRMRRVPLLVWANFLLPREDSELSVNALPSYLLARMGIPAPGFLAMTDEVRRRIPVVGSYLQGPAREIWSWESLPARERALLDDYRLLQYDLLFGGRYALQSRP